MNIFESSLRPFSVAKSSKIVDKVIATRNKNFTACYVHPAIKALSNTNSIKQFKF